MRDFFYDLLPAIYRELDQAEGSPLRALLHIMDEEHFRLLAEMDRMYEGWFAETCALERLPAIASLLIDTPLPVRRAFVANTIASRRRKGTFAALERRISDASGWPALAILRADERNSQHRLEVYVWRQTAYHMENATPHCLGSGRYLFHPMGVETPLFHVPLPQYDVERRMTLENMPLRLYRNTPRELRTPLTVEIPSRSRHPLPIEFRDLSHWEIPAAIHEAHEQPHHGIYAVVDPALGRLMITEPGLASREGDLSRPEYLDLRVNFAYGFTADIGGGPYPRLLAPPPKDSWVAYVQREAPSNLVRKNIFPSLKDALEAFRASPCCGTIVFTDSSTHHLPSELIDATGWVCPKSIDGQRTLELRSMNDEVPCLRGNLRIHAGGLGLQLTLNGLWIDGLIEIGGALSLELKHCTIRPTDGHHASHRGIRPLPGHHPALQVKLDSSICGPVVLPSSCMGLSATGSIVESITAMHPEDHQLQGEQHVSPSSEQQGFHANLQYTTVIGAITGARVENKESILGAEHISRPAFVSARYGDPSYACLRDNAPGQLLTGATDGSQMGAFHSIHEALRNEQAKAALEEFTPANLPSKLIFIPEHNTERPSDSQTSNPHQTTQD